MRKGDWIQTFTGRKFWPIDPRPEEIFLEDIAHSLACQCRFAGHAKCFYSVAQHSFLVSTICTIKNSKWALLHDATEAYLVDLPRPIKRYSKLGEEYKKIEKALMDCVCQRFGIDTDEPEEVKESDSRILMTEKRDLLLVGERWPETAEPIGRRIIAWDWKQSENVFLAAASSLDIF